MKMMPQTPRKLEMMLIVLEFVEVELYRATKTRSVAKLKTNRQRTQTKFPLWLTNENKEVGPYL